MSCVSDRHCLGEEIRTTRTVRIHRDMAGRYVNLNQAMYVCKESDDA
jgi:hypothetical protein